MITKLDWLNTISNIFITLGVAALGIWAFITGLQAYLAWRERMAEIQNKQALKCINLIEENEKRYQQLVSEIEELEKDFREENKGLYSKIEKMHEAMAEYHRDSIDMMAVAFKIKKPKQ